MQTEKEQGAPLTGGPVGRSVRPVAWAVFATNGNIRMWSQDSEPVRKLAEETGLPLTPLYIIPEGWQLVPKQPTREMLFAGGNNNESGKDFEAYRPSECAAIYRDMLSAAPSPNLELTGGAPTDTTKRPA